MSNLVVKKLVPSHAREIAKWTGHIESEVLDELRSSYTSKYGVFEEESLFGVLVVSKISDLKHIVKWHHFFPHSDEQIELEAAATSLLLDKWLSDTKQGVNLEFGVSEWKLELHLLLKSFGFKARVERGTKEDFYIFERVK